MHTLFVVSLHHRVTLSVSAWLSVNETNIVSQCNLRQYAYSTRFLLCHSSYHSTGSRCNSSTSCATLTFEYNAALVASSPSLFASEMRTLLATLPPNWDLLDLDPHPDFCDGSLWRQPKRRVVSGSAMPSNMKVYQTYTTFSRTAATVVSWNGAMKLLRRLPADVAVDIFIAKIMRQGALNVFVACDNNVIRQQTSTMGSIGG